MRRSTQALVAPTVLLALVLTGCTGKGGKAGDTSTAGTKGTGMFAKCGSSPNDCNTAAVKQGGRIVYTMEATLTGWNLNSATSNSAELIQVLDGVIPSVFIAQPDLTVALNPDLMVSAEQTSTDPQTLVYKIRPEAVWNDGTPIEAADFDYAWKTSNGRSCPKCAASSSSGYDQVESLTRSDDGKTVTLVMKKPYSDWQSMFGALYPARLAAEHGDLTTPQGRAASFAWLDKTQPTYSGGPYLVDSADKEVSVTEVPNPKWYGTVKPSLDQLVFRVVEDGAPQVAALGNHEVQVIYPTPSLDVVRAAQALPGVDTYLGRGLIWEHLDLNTTGKLLKDKVLRRAIFTAIDRRAILDKTFGQFVPRAELLNNHMYVPGQPGYRDNITATGQGSGDLDKAKKMLSDAGYTGVGSALKNKAGLAVSIRCSYIAENLVRQQICLLLRAQLGALGIPVKPTLLSGGPDLGAALEATDFDLIAFSWIGTPFVVAGAQQLYTLKGGSDYGRNDDPAAAALLDAAAAETDPAKVREDVNRADALLAADAYSLPLFQQPTFLAAYSNIANIRDNATSTGPAYLVQAWGLRSS